jgi:hypothetical protein
MPTSKQVGNDPAVHIAVPAPGKDATPIRFARDTPKVEPVRIMSTMA